MNHGDEIHKGSCLCGAITFEVNGPLPPGDGCHCTQCRRWTGHFLAGTDVPRSAVKISGENNIKWFQSSEKARRGFCSTCGSSLFWDPTQKDWIGLSLGAFDTPTNTKLGLHGNVSSKGDYYEIADGLPQKG